MDTYACSRADCPQASTPGAYSFCIKEGSPRCGYNIVICRTNINLICRRAISDKPVKLIGYYYATFVCEFLFGYNWYWCRGFLGAGCECVEYNIIGWKVYVCRDIMLLNMACHLKKKWNGIRIDFYPATPRARDSLCVINIA